jgi:NADPH-ferrihemoprotein reductase
MEYLSDPSTLGGLVVGVVIIGFTWYLMRPKSASELRSGDDSNVKERSSSFDVSKFPGGKICIFFGSQTGTAEGYAKIMMDKGRGHGFDAELYDLETFEPEAMKESKVAIFIMSTYGEGEPTDNSHKFYNWIRPDKSDTDADVVKAQPGDLCNVKFSVFGLGNKQYEHFNRMGRTTDEYLERAGAQRIVPYGEGDDDGNLEEDFEKWQEGAWATLVGALIGADAAEAMASGPRKVSLNFDVKLLTASEAAAATRDGPVYKQNQIQSSTKHLFLPHCALAPVIVNRELRSVNSQSAQTLKGKGGKDALEVGSTRHIEFDISKTGYKYTTADNLAVLPENSSEVVTTFAAAMHYDLDQMFTTVPPEGVDAKKFQFHFPVPCTVREALTSFVDLCGLPMHGTVERLLPYVEDSAQRQWLEALIAKDAKANFKQYINGNGKSLFDLLTSELSSCRVPLADMLHILPAMQPRYYTISSSSSVHPTTVHITVSVTEFALPSGRLFRGLTSGYLQGAAVGTTVRVFVRASTFRLPKKNNTPIVMVGPGTGIAPMRALIQERSFRHGKGEAAPKNTLFFGCKYRDVDYIYRDELESAAAQNEAGLVLHTCFSREQKEKIYVQHLLQRPENAAAFIADLDAGGYLYVCGATSMGGDVHSAFIQLLKQEKKMSEAAATTYVKNLKSNGRYVQELWSS